MKWRAEWWGVVLIPETEEDVITLDGLTKDADAYYEDGGSGWESDIETLAKNLRCPEFDLPMGKAMVLNR